MIKDTEIPADIRLLAALLARRHEERAFCVGGQTTAAIAADIAKALALERERCAKIAESHIDAERAEYGAQYSEQIATAIRLPS